MAAKKTTKTKTGKRVHAKTYTQFAADLREFLYSAARDRVGPRAFTDSDTATVDVPVTFTITVAKPKSRSAYPLPCCICYRYAGGLIVCVGNCCAKLLAP